MDTVVLTVLLVLAGSFVGYYLLYRLEDRLSGSSASPDLTTTISEHAPGGVSARPMAPAPSVKPSRWNLLGQLFPVAAFALPATLLFLGTGIAQDLRKRLGEKREDLVKTHLEFIREATERLEKLNPLLQTPLQIDDSFQVLSCDFVKWPGDREVRTAGRYRIKPLAGGWPAAFPVLVGGAEAVASPKDIGFSWKYRENHNDSWESQGPETWQAASVPRTGLITAFVIDLNLPPNVQSDSLEVEIEYTWPFHEKPAMVAYFDPRIYKRLDSIGIHVAVKQPLEFWMAPRFDEHENRFDLFKTSNAPYEIVVLEGGPASREIAGTWKDEKDREREYSVFCLGQADPKFPSAIVYQRK